MSSFRILIVDDQDFCRRGLRSLIASRTDWVVCGEAQDGIEAVDKAKSLQPDVVLMDISMPRMNGLDATRIIRRELPEAKVVIVSQNNPALGCRQAKEVNAAGYVDKSDLSRDLISTVDRLLQKQTSKSAEHSQPVFSSIGQGQREEHVRGRNDSFSTPDTVERSAPPSPPIADDEDEKIVTQRNEAEEAVREKERRLRLATEAAQLGIWNWNLDEDRVTWENDRPYENSAAPASEAKSTRLSSGPASATPMIYPRLKKLYRTRVKTEFAWFFRVASTEAIVTYGGWKLPDALNTEPTEHPYAYLGRFLTLPSGRAKKRLSARANTGCDWRKKLHTPALGTIVLTRMR